MSQKSTFSWCIAIFEVSQNFKVLLVGREGVPKRVLVYALDNVDSSGRPLTQWSHVVFVPSPRIVNASVWSIAGFGHHIYVPNVSVVLPQVLPRSVCSYLPCIPVYDQ